MTDTQQIPLKKLTLDERNVRKTGAENDLAELAASIEAHGLLQSLVVRPVGRGKFAVVAGGRRLRALQLLAEAGKLKAAHAVPCMVIADDASAEELSLAENIVRAPMHPADQFEAFRAVIDQGATLSDVAARFGVSEGLVAKRLALGRLSPVILDAYRKEALDLEQVQAFAVSDDHAAQERLLRDAPPWNLRPREIRQALTEGEVPLTDKRAKLVGIEAYESAGGCFRRDLFGGEDGFYLQDAALLTRLAADKLEEAAQAVREEGWKWTLIEPEADYATFSCYDRRYPDRKPLSKKARKERDRLAAEYDSIVESLEDDDANASERLDALQAQIDALDDTGETWPAETRAIAGAVVSIGHDGAIAVERGLVRREDARAEKAASKAKAKADGSSASAANTLSAKLIEDLTARKTAAIRAELAKQPAVALAAVVYSLALGHFGHSYDGSSLELRTHSKSLGIIPDEPDGKAQRALEEVRQCWGDVLPTDPNELWQWCLAQRQDTLLELLAYLAACTVNAMQGKHDRPYADRLVHANALAQALTLDMNRWFSPTAANFFSRVSRSTILAALDEAKGGHGPALDKLKKADLAARAEQMLACTGWLPEPLRTVNSYDEPEHTVAQSDDVSQAAE